jgi:hypothetical protein
MFAGWELRDPLGRRIGRVSRVFLARAGPSAHADVVLGPFRKRTVLLPVEGFRVDRDARVIYLGKDRRRPGGDEPGGTGTPRGGAVPP